LGDLKAFPRFTFKRVRLWVSRDPIQMMMDKASDHESPELALVVLAISFVLERNRERGG
jgi:hypothetical protein